MTRIYWIIVSVLVIAIFSYPSINVGASTLYVDPSGLTCPGVYTTVTGAITAATSRSTIILCDDVTESLTFYDINKDVIIDGYYNMEFHIYGGFRIVMIPNIYCLTFIRIWNLEISMLSSNPLH